MESTVWLVIVCLGVVLSGQRSPLATSVSNSTDPTLAGYGFEVVLSKMDYLQYTLHEMELTVKERDEELTERLVKFEDTIEKLQWAVNRHDETVGHNLTALQAHVRDMLAQQAACANHEQMRKEIAQLTAKHNISYDGLTPEIRHKRTYRSCDEVTKHRSGVYWLRATNDGAPFEAFCEQDSFGGGWLVIHYRYDGTLKFYRPWAEYRHGFGSAYKEHWIGLERLHQLTAARSYELMVEMKDFTGTYAYAHYKEFVIGSEAEMFSLKKLGAYDGTAGDSLSHHQGAKFTTKDKDNDENGSNCAVTYEGAWWYRNCHASNLNGFYMNKDDAQSMCWQSYKSNYQGLAYARMMIRET